MARHQETPAVERRIARTIAKLEPERQRERERTAAKDERMTSLRAAVRRHRVARSFGEEVAEAERAFDDHPDADLVRRLEAERIERRGG